MTIEFAAKNELGACAYVHCRGNIATAKNIFLYNTTSHLWLFLNLNLCCPYSSKVLDVMTKGALIGCVCVH